MKATVNAREVGFGRSQTAYNPIGIQPILGVVAASDIN
jgi:hypothetical protein